MADDNATSDETMWTPGRILATAVVAVLVATIGYVFFFGHVDVKTDSRVALPGTPVSDTTTTVVSDFSIPTMDGATINLSNYRGKVVVLDFWATWCPPCREEIPQLVRIADQNRARGLEVVGLHIDDRGRSTPDAIRRFRDRYNIDYTIGMASDQMFLDYLGREDDTIPQTLVFGRDGKLVKHLIGYTDSHARVLDEAVNSALAQP